MIRGDFLMAEGPIGVAFLLYYASSFLIRKPPHKSNARRRKDMTKEEKDSLIQAIQKSIDAAMVTDRAARIAAEAINHASDLLGQILKQNINLQKKLEDADTEYLTENYSLPRN